MLRSRLSEGDRSLCWAPAPQVDHRSFGVIDLSSRFHGPAIDACERAGGVAPEHCTDATKIRVRMANAALPRDSIALAPPEAWAPPELSIVVPTLNENGNVPLLVVQLTRALKGLRWEVIFVDDDSEDGTLATARSLARRDPRIRCLRRIGRRGLAGALSAW